GARIARAGGKLTLARDRRRPPPPSNGKGSSRSATGAIASPPVPRGRFSERMRAASPYPPLGGTLGRAFLAVCTTPAALFSSLAFVGAAWLALVAIGVVVFPILIVEALAV